MSLALLGALAVVALGPEPAVAQADDRRTAASPGSVDIADPRTAAYRECHEDSTARLYGEHPMCQPGMAPRQPLSADKPCPYSGGDRMAEIMRLSAECMRAKGH